MNARPYGVVAHEAAHVVVGAALGLRLRSAVVRAWFSDGASASGWTWFDRMTPTESRLVDAAGVAWSQSTGDGLSHVDERRLRRAVSGGRSDFRAYVVAAGAILESRATAHARVVRALLEHDLTHVDIERLAIGVAPTRLREEDT